MQRRGKHTSTTKEGLCFLRGPYRGVILKTIGATVQLTLLQSTTLPTAASGVEAESNMSTAVVVGGDEKGTQCLGV
jgi:hypothetical protein